MRFGNQTHAIIIVLCSHIPIKKQVSIRIKELPGYLHSSLYDMLQLCSVRIQPESDCTKPQNEVVVQSSSPQYNTGQSSQAQQATPTAIRNQPRVPVWIFTNRPYLELRTAWSGGEQWMCMFLCVEEQQVHGEAMWLCKLPILVWL